MVVIFDIFLVLRAKIYSGEITSITIIEEGRSDHYYVILLIIGSDNIERHFGTAGGLFTFRNEIDNKHYVPFYSCIVPEWSKGKQPKQMLKARRRRSLKKLPLEISWLLLSSVLIRQLFGIKKGLNAEGFLILMYLLFKFFHEIVSPGTKSFC